ncbi:hypothetical protein A0H81_03816 [Grifola frondosa]|uniref:Glutamyl-tRNA(Gln) amidotransferase subunit F, mitochondrial n=1 Tax=Grifola frondosa TaxID=5627 RepID=A0A1C7MJB1_GRIFR|nr:hypothetical protein A0H81_03816 [Grifola frondosa]
MYAHRCLKQFHSLSRWSYLRRLQSTSTKVAFDSCGIPLKPTWSVNDLLSSYPRPTITPSTLKRLHELSALIPPADGTPEHRKLTQEMEGLVKLVEAVKLVDTSGVVEEAHGEAVPDGRIWAAGTGIELDCCSPQVTEGDRDRELLRHAARVMDGLYVVDADKPRN